MTANCATDLLRTLLFPTIMVRTLGSTLLRNHDCGPCFGCTCPSAAATQCGDFCNPLSAGRENSPLRLRAEQSDAVLCVGVFLGGLPLCVRSLRRCGCTVVCTTTGWDFRSVQREPVAVQELGAPAEQIRRHGAPRHHQVVRADLRVTGGLPPPLPCPVCCRLFSLLLLMALVGVHRGCCRRRRVAARCSICVRGRCKSRLFGSCVVACAAAAACVASRRRRCAFPRVASEWMVNQHRDSLASHIGHHDFLSFVAVAENESIGRVRYTMLEKMLAPCGLPPAKEEDS